MLKLRMMSQKSVDLIAGKSIYFYPQYTCRYTCSIHAGIPVVYLQYIHTFIHVTVLSESSNISY